MPDHPGNLEDSFDSVSTLRGAPLNNPQGGSGNIAGAINIGRRRPTANPSKTCPDGHPLKPGMKDTHCKPCRDSGAVVRDTESSALRRKKG